MKKRIMYYMFFCLLSYTSVSVSHAHEFINTKTHINQALISQVLTSEDPLSQKQYQNFIRTSFNEYAETYIINLADSEKEKIINSDSFQEKLFYLSDLLYKHDLDRQNEIKNHLLNYANVSFEYEKDELLSYFMIRKNKENYLFNLPNSDKTKILKNIQDLILSDQSLYKSMTDN